MSHLKKRKSIIKYLETHLEDGPMKEPLNTIQPSEDIDGTKLIKNKALNNKKKKPEKKLYTLEYPLRQTNKILTKKLNILQTSTKIIKSSKISEAQLITTDGPLKTFWTPHLQEISKRLYYIPNNPSEDLEKNLSKTPLNISIPNSSLNYVTSQNDNYKTIKFTDISQNTEYQKVNRTIRFFPSTALKQYMKQCFGTHRYFFNKGVYEIKQKYSYEREKYKQRKLKGLCCYTGRNNIKCSDPIIFDENNNRTYFCKKHKKQKLKFSYYNISDLRNKVIRKQKHLTNDIKWQKNTPYDLKQNALRLLLANQKAGITNKVRNQVDYNMKYIKKKSRHNIFKIPSNFIDIKKKILLAGYGSKKQFRFHVSKKTESWLKKNNYKLNDTITIGQSGNKYYIYASYDVKPKTIEKPFNTVSIDPGVRTFGTMYSPDGLEGDLGKGVDKELYNKYAKKLDKLKSLRTKKEIITNNQGNKISKFVNNAKTRKNMKSRCNKLSDKIKNKVRDLHYKIINFLCLNFRTILLPKFDPSKKVKKYNRKINNETVRNMLTLSHGKFLERLINYCKKVNTQLILTTEEYTSKTCGRCGYVKFKLKGEKIYNCNACKLKIDRDLNGARNILLRALSKLKVKINPFS